MLGQLGLLPQSLGMFFLPVVSASEAKRDEYMKFSVSSVIVIQYISTLLSPSK